MEAGNGRSAPRSWEKYFQGLGIDQSKVVALRKKVLSDRRSQHIILVFIALAAAALTVAGIALAKTGGKLTLDEAGILNAIAAIGLAVWAFLGKRVPAVSHTDADRIVGKSIPGEIYLAIQDDCDTGMTLWVPLLIAIVVFIVAVLQFVTA